MVGGAILAELSYGWYVSIWKSVLMLLTLLVWVRLLTWVDKDAPSVLLPRIQLNSVFFGGLILALVLFFFLPVFLVAYPIFLVIFFAEVGAYLAIRNKKAGLSDLSVTFNAWLASKTGSSKAIAIPVGQVTLMNSKGGAMAVPTEPGEELDAFEAAQSLLSDPLRRRAEKIEMRASAKDAVPRYLVDGVAFEGKTITRSAASGAVNLLKMLAGLDLADRRKPQHGTMRAAVDGSKVELQIHTAGSTSGESISIDVDPKKRNNFTLDQTGMAEDQLEEFSKIVADPTGIVLLAAPVGNGQTSLLYAVLRKHDAFLSNMQSIERDPKVDLEGVTQSKVTGVGAGDEPKLAEWVTSQEPDVIMIDHIENKATAATLINFAAKKRIYIGVRAGNVFDALATWRSMVGDDKLAIKNLKLVVAGRLIRKLCPTCKVEFNPDPEMLRRLNLSPDRVGTLYTARANLPPGTQSTDPADLLCPFCSNMRYTGRTGVYELFVVDDDVRMIISTGGSVNQLKMIFKKQRQKYIQDRAVDLVIDGQTSIQEVIRVLRADAPAKPRK